MLQIIIKNFVASRIERIHYVGQYFTEVIWRYCPTKLNPADVSSHGLIMNHKNLEKLESWMNGLSFLSIQDQRPTDINHDTLLKTIVEDDLELKSTYTLKPNAVNSLLFNVLSEEHTMIQDLIRNTSPLEKLCVKFAWIK